MQLKCVVSLALGETTVYEPNKQERTCHQRFEAPNLLGSVVCEAHSYSPQLAVSVECVPKQNIVSQYLHSVCLGVLQVLSRSGSVAQQHHFIDLLGLNVVGSGMNKDEVVVRGSERNCVKLRGLPWASTAEEVIEFFGDLGSDIAPHGVHMVLNAMVGRLCKRC